MIACLVRLLLRWLGLGGQNNNEDADRARQRLEIMTTRIDALEATYRLGRHPHDVD